MYQYQERTYQQSIQAEGLVRSHVWVDESDLCILASADVTNLAEDLLREVRADLLAYLQRDERFRLTLDPYEPLFDAPLVAVRMAAAARRFEVGPMAAVAGAIADCVGEQLSQHYPDVVVENGGDIYLRCERQVLMTVYAGERSPFAGKLRFLVQHAGRRMGVCTSSGTVGHSFSKGKADAVCVVAESSADADAAATFFGNQVQSCDDINRVVDSAMQRDGVLGILVAIGDRLGVWGAVEIL
jgi:ApbE superfamily uncharacterized protein (UPF0280 family)